LNDYLLSILLGIVEGLTEFLPVSSTAHLRIVEALAGVNLADGYWKMFAIFIQLGAILCLPILFVERIAGFVRTFPGGRNSDRTALTHPLTLTLVAFVCTAAPVFLLRKIVGANLESLLVMGCSLIVGGIIMWLVDVYCGTRGEPDVERIRLHQAIWIGLCQVLAAVFPGTSRSMATIAAGQAVGLSRSAALEFSFLVSIPTMAAATCYDLLKTVRSGEAHMDTHGWTLLAIGFVVSFLVAYAVVAWFLHWVRRHGFTPFAIYRIVVGAVVLFWHFRRG
jgi:undecaprenyl-diphosphatase